MKHRHIRRLAIVAGIAALVIFFLYQQNHWIDSEHLRMKVEGLKAPLRVVQVSDTHLRKDGPEVDAVLAAVKKSQPDLILLTGDILDESAVMENSGLERLARGLSAMAPGFAVTGNHEYSHGNVAGWKALLTAADIKVLDNSQTTFSKNGNRLILAGLAGSGAKVLRPLEGSDPVLVLFHYPEKAAAYVRNLTGSHPVVVFSGHAHGGQMRLPFTGQGLYAPGQGFFPAMTSGLYPLDNGGTLVLSRGLGNSRFPLRVFDRPHLPVVQLLPGE